MAQAWTPIHIQAGERMSGRSSGHGQSSGAVYPFWLGSARTGSFVKLTTWSGPAGQGDSHEEPYSRSCSAATPKRPLLKNRLGSFGFNDLVSGTGFAGMLFNTKSSQVPMVPRKPESYFSPDALAGESVR